MDVKWPYIQQIALFVLLPIFLSYAGVIVSHILAASIGSKPTDGGSQRLGQVVTGRMFLISVVLGVVNVIRFAALGRSAFEWSRLSPAGQVAVLALVTLSVTLILLQVIRDLLGKGIDDPTNVGLIVVATNILGGSLVVFSIWTLIGAIPNPETSNSLLHQGMFTAGGIAVLLSLELTVIKLRHTEVVSIRHFVSKVIPSIRVRISNRVCVVMSGGLFLFGTILVLVRDYQDRLFFESYGLHPSSGPLRVIDLSIGLVLACAAFLSLLTVLRAVVPWLRLAMGRAGRNTRDGLSVRRVASITASLVLFTVSVWALTENPGLVRHPPRSTIFVDSPLTKAMLHSSFDFEFDVTYREGFDLARFSKEVLAWRENGGSVPAYFLHLEPANDSLGNMSTLIITRSDGYSHTIDSCFLGSELSLLEISGKLRDRVFASIGDEVGTGEQDNNSIQTDSLTAYSSHLRGLLELNQYTMESLKAATHHFRSAIEVDSQFAAPYLYVAYSHNQLARRQWDTETGEDYIRQSREYLVKARSLLANKNHPLFRKVRGDYAYIQGYRFLRECLEAKQIGDDPFFWSDKLALAKACFEKAQVEMVASIKSSPGYYKTKNNLGHCYLRLYEVDRIMSPAKPPSYFLSLAELAFLESARSFGYDHGPDVQIARVWLYRYLDSETKNLRILDEADSLLSAILTDTGYMPLRDVWISTALYSRAAIQLARPGSSVESALSDLTQANRIGSFNVRQVALEDEAFAGIHALIRESTSVEEALEIWRRSDHPPSVL